MLGDGLLNQGVDLSDVEVVQQATSLVTYRFKGESLFSIRAIDCDLIDEGEHQRRAAPSLFVIPVHSSIASALSSQDGWKEMMRNGVRGYVLYVSTSVERIVVSALTDVIMDILLM